jgi:hypothetical protein
VAAIYNQDFLDLAHQSRLSGYLVQDRWKGVNANRFTAQMFHHLQSRFAGE